MDSKGREHAFLRSAVLARGHDVVAINVGVLGTTDLFPIDVEAAEVARSGGGDLDQLRTAADRGAAMQVMCAGAAVVVKKLYEAGRISGIIGMGGSGGTTVVTSAMRALPIGIPKVCVSTVASGNVASYVGTKNITMIPSIVDVSGINRVSRIIFSQAAAAICGMVDAPATDNDNDEDKPLIGASMFGNTTECVDACVASLSEKGYEVLVFHATGTGGRTMEGFVDDGLIDGVLDITTTEWADTLCGGILAAGTERLEAPGRAGIPHLIVPGCVDMVNFGSMATVPDAYKKAKRTFYEWNPANTLMRTNKEENEKMGRIFADKANAAKGPIAFLIPLRGLSVLDGEGGPFCDWETNAVMFDAIKTNLRPDIPVVEMNNNINDPEFSAKAVAMLMELFDQANE